LRLFSFGGYGLALAALALAVFGAYDSYPFPLFPKREILGMARFQISRSYNFIKSHKTPSHYFYCDLTSTIL